MEKNNNESFKQTRLIIVLVAIIVILVFVVGVLLGSRLKTNTQNNTDNSNKVVDKKENKDNKKEKEEENKEEEYTEVEKDEETLNDPDSVLNKIMNYLPAKYENLKADGLTNKEKLNVAFYMYEYDTGWHNSVITKNEIKNTMEKVLGDNITYLDEDVVSLNDNEVLAYYNDKKEVYRYNESSAHGFEGMVAYNYIVSEKKNNNKLIVDVKRFYFLHRDTGPIEEMYADVNGNKKIIVEDKYCDEEGLKDGYCAVNEIDLIKDHPERFISITYTFDITDDYPTFVEMKKN